MGSPKVTVFIPTYNYARYLKETIESVLEQEFTDFELIIADDASTDDSCDVIRHYADKDKRIRFYSHEKNKGMVENWNWCMAQASGEYIKPLLGDDCLNAPDALGRMVEILDDKPEVALVTSARLLIDESSKPMGGWGPYGIWDRIIPGKKVIECCLLNNENLIGEPSAVMFRNADGSRGFDQTYRQLVDLEMWLYLLETGSLAYLGDTLCCFRRHPLQQTEINNEIGIGERESLRIFDSYGQSLCTKYIIFTRIYALRKSKNPALRSNIPLLRERLTSLEMFGCCIAYKIRRPFQNFYRSYIKRRWRRHALTRQDDDLLLKAVNTKVLR